MKRTDFQKQIDRASVHADFTQKLTQLSTLFSHEFQGADDIKVLRSKVVDAKVYLDKAIFVFLED